MFNLLRLSLLLRDQRWRDISATFSLWAIGTIGIVALCQTTFFLQAATIPLPVGSAAPVPQYGSGIFVYAVFFIAAIVALVISTWRDLRSTSGGEHAELAFILIGGLSALTFTLLLSFTLGLFHRVLPAALVCTVSRDLFQSGCRLWHRDQKDHGGRCLLSPRHLRTCCSRRIF